MSESAVTPALKEQMRELRELQDRLEKEFTHGAELDYTDALQRINPVLLDTVDRSAERIEFLENEKACLEKALDEAIREAHIEGLTPDTWADHMVEKGVRIGIGYVNGNCPNLARFIRYQKARSKDVKEDVSANG